MRLFHGNFSKSYGWGAFDEHDCIIIANTEEEALGLALTHYPETVADGWSFEEISTDKLLCYPVSSRIN